MANPTNPDDARALAQALADLGPSERHLARRLLALLSGSSPSLVPVVRAERVEVVDHRGATRVSLGQVGGDEGDAFGIGIYDRSGSERITLAVGEVAAWLSFSLEGDEALVAGVHDPDSRNLRPGPHLMLLRADGTVGAGWWVDADSGTVSTELDAS